MTLRTVVMKTPIGRLTLVAKDDAIVAVALEGGEPDTRRWLARRFGTFREERHADPAGAVSALRAYFEGDLGALDRVRVDMGGTPFQQSVWEALRRIPAGGTISYAELARRVGRPKSFRAVGAANGSNPVAVIVPCHRVIAANGTMGGYGGGLDRKRWLLDHERAPTEPEAPPVRRRGAPRRSRAGAASADRALPW